MTCVLVIPYAHITELLCLSNSISASYFYAVLSFQPFPSPTQKQPLHLLIPTLHEQKYNHHIQNSGISFNSWTSYRVCITSAATYPFLNGFTPQQPFQGRNVLSETSDTNKQIRMRSLYDGSYEVIKRNTSSYFQTRKNEPHCNIRCSDSAAMLLKIEVLWEVLTAQQCCWRLKSCGTFWQCSNVAEDWSIVGRSDSAAMLLKIEVLWEVLTAQQCCWRLKSCWTFWQRSNVAEDWSLVGRSDSAAM